MGEKRHKNEDSSMHSVLLVSDFSFVYLLVVIVSVIFFFHVFQASFPFIYEYMYL